MRSMLTALACLLCAACGGASNEASDDESDSVFEPMTRTLDDAAEVEEKVLQQKEQLDEALRRMEGDDDEP